MSDTGNDPGIDTATDAIRRASRVTVLTGAGVSAASGIRTFRGADASKGQSPRSGAGPRGPGERMGPGGVQGPPPWSKVRAETLATPEAFEHDPKLVWEWYDWRRQMIRDAQPNAAHHVLARWTKQRPGTTVVTQNVDGLHERAGAEGLVRLHGSIWRLRCRNPCEAGRTDWLDDTVPLPVLPPRCPHCGGLVRPAVVWFGESLDPNILAAADRATACDVFLTVGTSSVVYPAAGLVHRARQHGAMTIEINVEATDASGVVDVSLRGKAEEILGEIDRRLPSDL